MIPCTSRLVPANGQSFALLEDIYFAGGFRTLASVEEMQNTHVSARKAGMHVFYYTRKSVYIYPEILSGYYF